MSKHEGLLEDVYWEGAKPRISPTSAYTSAVNWCKDILRPEFFEKRRSRPPPRRTAYLDGLRGFAALVVYWGHHQLWAHKAIEGHRIFENGFGFDKQFYFAALPGIRTFFSGGHFAVSVFFVISGYVLSTKPLLLLQSGEYVKLGDNLASALFRRWARLYIPVACITFLYMTSWHAFGLWTLNTTHQSTYRDELWAFYTELKNFSFLFNTGGEPWFSYDMHTWSISVEMKGSIVIYTSLLAFSRATRNARLWCQLGLMFYFMYIADGAHYSMFVAGMLLADLDLLAMNNDLPRFFSAFAPFKDIIFYSMFVVSIYLGGIPQASKLTDLRLSHGWYYLSFLKPQAVYDYKWFFLFIAAVLLVASTPRISSLKSFFELRFCQYLGRISFAFYLVHGPVMWTLGDRLYVAAGWSTEEHMPGGLLWMNLLPIPRVGPLGLELSFLLPHLIILPVTLWFSEIATKLFDEPSVKFLHWIYSKTLGGAGPDSRPYIGTGVNKMSS